MVHMNFYSSNLKGVAVHRPLLGKRSNLIKISWFKKKKTLIAVFIQDGCRVKPYHLGHSSKDFLHFFGSHY